jgi:DNA repair protein RadD
VVLNVECLTTGFDFPSLDSIVVLRPTNSIRLHVQMLGRGVRVAEGKKTCDIIDLVGNVKKLGRIETIRVEKVGGSWDIVSETGTWHNKELYSYLIER